MKALAPFATEIAPHVDRLVIAVHRQMRTIHGDAISKWRDDTGLETPGLLINLRPFILAGTESRLTAERFHRYALPSAFELQVAAAISAGILTREFRVTPKARELAVRLTNLQADLMAQMWSDAPEVDAVTPLVERVVVGIPAHYPGRAFSLAHEWVAADRPTHREYRLHHLLTALRYLRADCHSEILEEAELSPGEAARLDASWREQEGSHHDHPLENLVLRGLVTPDGDITPDGTAYRQAVEDETNSAAAAAWIVLSADERKQLLIDLAQLPDHVPA